VTLDIAADFKVYGVGMSSSLRIAEVADRVGISTATVRYYERIGVLPAAERADNGYRMYDDRTVERLEFVARAKQLGCTLEEITDLVTAWDGGECGPIQDRLRTLVADKLAATHAEVVELVALTADLRRAAASLEHHRPIGRCDDRCGCIIDTSDDAAARPTGVAFTAKPIGDDTPIACTLRADELPARLHDWNTLVNGDGVTRSAIDGGIRLVFDDQIDVAELARLAAAEQDCCRFFSFRIGIARAGVTLDVTAPDDARDLVRAVFGAPS
jgi:MerR family copper efflux transcriptional regulator